ncbi:hypothetical protein cypCar_00037133 [Cyprinus carpio]|nr:hypothetical protein cypCar_00037133 [Cyprinus carpio]
MYSGVLLIQLLPELDATQCVCTNISAAPSSAQLHPEYCRFTGTAIGKNRLETQAYAAKTQSDVVSFDGSAHLLFRPDPSDSLADRDVLSMNFKTLLNSGMLVHMEEHSGHSFTLELFRGKLLLQLRKGFFNQFSR